MCFFFFQPILDILLIHMHSGEKKKHRKETIATKRRERMLCRGVDLEQINLVRKRLHNVIAFGKISSKIVLVCKIRGAFRE